MHTNTDKESVLAKPHTGAAAVTTTYPSVVPPSDEAMQAFNAACVSLSEASVIRLRAEEAEQRAMVKALTIDPFLSDAKRNMLIQSAERHADNAAAAANERALNTDLLRFYCANFFRCNTLDAADGYSPASQTSMTPRS